MIHDLSTQKGRNEYAKSDAEKLATPMSFDEFMKNKPKSVTGTLYSDGKLVKRTFYWSYSKYIDRQGWFNRNRGKSITHDVAYTLYQESQEVINTKTV